MAVLLAGSVMPVFAQEDGRGPGMIAHRCALRIAAITHRTVHAIQHETQPCVLLITYLKNAGHEEMAAHVAENCVRRVNMIAAHGVEAIGAVTQRCVNVLQEHGAPEEVIQGLQQQAETAVMTIQEAKERAIHLIQEALNGE